MSTGNFNIQSSGGGIINVKAPEAIAINGTVTFPSSGTLAITDSPVFTGTPTLPTGTIGITQASGDNSTKLATTAFVTGQDLGVGQTWQDMTASRTVGVTYTNTTGKPITVCLSIDISGAAGALYRAAVSGIVVWDTKASSAYQDYVNIFLIIPTGGTYSVTQTAGTYAIMIWTELR